MLMSKKVAIALPEVLVCCPYQQGLSSVPHGLSVTRTAGTTVLGPEESPSVGKQGSHRQRRECLSPSPGAPPGPSHFPSSQKKGGKSLGGGEPFY